MECIILAGGLGTRLRSVVGDVPKCMAPIADKPFLYYLLQWIGKYNVNRVVLSVGYLHEIIEKWIADNKNLFPFEIDFAVEHEPLGTGGAIRLALDKINSDKAVIINGDTFFDIDIDRFVKQHNQHNATLSMALKPMKKFDRYGNVLLKNNIVVGFAEKQFCEEGLINGGIYMINKENRFFDSLPAKFSFETEVLTKRAIHGFVFDNYFIDIGIPDDYARANRELYKLSEIDITPYQTLFIDRDGVINRLRPNDYVKTWGEFEFLPGVFDAFSRWNKSLKHIIVITNQRGVGLGLMTEEDLQTIHKKMISEIEKNGGRIDEIYYCTAVDSNDPNRKPNIGMALQAKHDFPDIDFNKTLMIGDSPSDMQFAENAGIKGITINNK